MSGTVTANTLITQALVKAGVTGQGRTPTANDLAGGLLELNMMLAQWQKQRWMVWGLTDTSLVSNGSQSYTVGPTQDFYLPYRPDRIEAAYIRQFGVGQNNPDPQSQLAATYLSGPGNPGIGQVPLGTCIDWLNTTTGNVERWCNYNGNLVLLAAQPDLQP
jgi:hypothetical protein